MSELKKRNIESIKSSSNNNGKSKTNTNDNKTAKNTSGFGELVQRGVSAIGGFIALNLVLSYLLTDSFTWGYTNRYTNWRNYIPRKELVLSEEELAKFDGSTPGLPIYLAINGEVYDVSAGPSYYGKGGGYSFFSGKDAARAFVTGCFKTHLTHDLRGFDDADMESVRGWQSFFKDHGTYYQIGKVIHPPIDPESPIPEDCEDGKRRSSKNIRKTT